MQEMKRKLSSILLKTGDALIWLVVGIFFLWSIGAIYYLTYLPEWIGKVLASLYAISIPVLLWRSGNRRLARGLIAFSIVAIFAATLLIRPSNDRSWAADQARVAQISIADDVVTINNFRNSVYRSDSDFDVTFETKQFELDQIESVWFIVQRFDVRDGLAHVFVSFGLKEASDPEFFSISIEIRREEGESYSPLRGMYRTYELTNVVGDERDLIGVRTIHRPDDRVFMYRVNATAQESQALFLKFAQRIEKLRAAPRFYNTLVDNCANGIVRLTYELTPEPINWLDPRIVLPGYSAKFGFEKGLIGDRKNGQTFDELQGKSRIDEIARRVGITESFSNDIRERQLHND